MRARDRGRGRRCARLIAVLILSAALVVLEFSSGAGAREAGRRSASRRLATPISVSVDRSKAGAAVPGDFLGLSFELSSLSRVASYAGSGDLVTMLRSLGRGVLRFGGASADTRVAWTDGATPRPAWASSVVERADFSALGNLAAESGWRVVLTIGLAHYEPEAAGREAAAAKAAMGEWLEGIEVGNEPNSFEEHGLRSEPWTFVQYESEVAAYRSAIEAAAPGIPLDGPDVSGSGAFSEWGLGEAVDLRPAELTGHHYPLGCEQVPAPSIGRLLSPLIRRKEGGSLSRYMSIARASDLPFRLDETNTVSCGGTAGISNTFASALWAVGYLSQTMTMGVAGVNLHGNPANCLGYAPVCAGTAEGLAAGALMAQPEWYALLLIKQLIGDRPLGTIVGSSGGANVRVKTLVAGDGALQFVIVDDDGLGARSVAVGLHVGRGFGSASVLSLTAPSPRAVSGVLLGGRAVATDGSWSLPRLPRAPNRHGVITVLIKPSSAALLTVSPTGGT
jgi:hypothetical protein